jgi:hypothetical protein
MGRNHLKGRDGDRINAVLAVAGYNLGLLLRWLAGLLRALRNRPETSNRRMRPAKAAAHDVRESAGLAWRSSVTRRRTARRSEQSRQPRSHPSGPRFEPRQRLPRF